MDEATKLKVLHGSMFGLSAVLVSILLLLEGVINDTLFIWVSVGLLVLICGIGQELVDRSPHLS